jgi:hypothetical protein
LTVEVVSNVNLRDDEVLTEQQEEATGGSRPRAAVATAASQLLVLVRAAR